MRVVVAPAAALSMTSVEVGERCGCEEVGGEAVAEPWIEQIISGW